MDTFSTPAGQWRLAEAQTPSVAGTTPSQLDEHERRFEELMREVAAVPLREGRARLEVCPAGMRSPYAPASVDLLPANPEASPLEVAIDSEWCLVVSVGRYGTYFEIFSKQVEDQIDDLRTLASGVVDGRYEEWVLLDEGKLTASLGHLSVPDGDDWNVGYNVFIKRLFPRRSDVEHVEYAPYGPALPTDRRQFPSHRVTLTRARRIADWAVKGPLLLVARSASQGEDSATATQA